MSKKGDTNITSFNQSGGVTAHTVNFGPQARQMNDELGQQIRQMIPVKSTKIKVTSLLGDGEGFAFANQILRWLKSSGYTDVDGVNQAVYSQPVMGQVLNQTQDGVDLIIGTRQ